MTSNDALVLTSWNTGPVSVEELAHSQLTFDTLPSGSERLAVIVWFSCANPEIDTDPGSFTFVTVTVSVSESSARLSTPPPPFRPSRTWSSTT